MKKGMFTGIVVIMVVAAAVIGIGQYKTRSRQSQLASQIIALGGGGTPQGIADLRKAIGLYEQKIEAHVKDAVQTGAYWKILAGRLSDKSMDKEALEALEHAISYLPEDPYLFYLTGLSAGVVAKSSMNFNGVDDRSRYFAIAEAGYLRAIELSPRYPRPRYGIGVLYAFELNRPAEAIPHLELFLTLTDNDTIDCLFVLARAYYMTGRFQNAIECYDRIIKESKNPTEKQQADDDKETVRRQMRG
ncbi:hypothetical protein FACS1894172_03990 [Spirochaetia bacterium]|nr:hypothetical protein FACS1894172_03990 [Spirochaetia bacterium]